jgi:hypothetical protein
MLELLTLKLVQSIVPLAVGVAALIYRRRLAQEMADKFKNVYGKFFHVEKVFETKWMRWYLEFAFIVFGIGALIFAIFNITVSINNL